VAPAQAAGKVAQVFPFAGEVSRQEQHQQQLDRLHGLKRAEVHFGIAARGTRTEANQQCEQQQGGEQGRVAPLGQPPVAAGAQQGGQQEQASAEDAPGEFRELQGIAQGIAQADHEDQADAGEQVQRNQ